jgi:mannitol/fructose-specific phosphotransferase system IIA component (Ntr-type)
MGFKDYIISESAVICNLEVQTWEEAVLQGGQLLVDKGKAKPEYLTNIVKKCKENGPYIVIAPGIAMPHARPEEGAMGLGYGIVTLKNPVLFGDPDNDPIKLLIYLVAPDAKDHNEVAVSQIADLCDNEDTIQLLLKAESASEIIQILKGEDR